MDAAPSLHGKYIGHLLLLTEDQSADAPPLPHMEECAVIDLKPLAAKIPTWQADGSMVGLRLLVPMVPLPAAELESLHLVVVGSGSELMAHAAREIQIGRVEIADESPAVLNAATPSFNRAFYGCGGKVPSVEQLLPMLTQLQPDGHFALFGLLEEHLSPVQKGLSDCGFSMRSAGVEDGFGFLSGSVESLQRLRQKQSLV